MIRIAFSASHEMQRMSEETRCVVGNVGRVAVKVLDDLFEFQPFGQMQSDTRLRGLHSCLPEPHVPFSEVDTLKSSGHRNVPTASVMVAIGHVLLLRHHVELLVHLVHTLTRLCSRRLPSSRREHSLFPSLLINNKQLFCFLVKLQHSIYTDFI